MLLNENFSFLVDELVKFVDPNIQYKSPLKMPGLKGGKRRIFRSTEYSSAYYKYMVSKDTHIDISNTSIVTLGSLRIPVTEWIVSHQGHKMPELGERRVGNSYTCKVTSLEALKKKVTDRVYVHCNCADFQFTFEQELAAAGYCNENPAAVEPTGNKKLAPAICKHLYTILMKKYSFIIMREPNSTPFPTTNFVMPTPTPATPAPSLSSPVVPPLPTRALAVPPVTVAPQAQKSKKLRHSQDLIAKLAALDAEAEKIAEKDPVKFISSKYGEYYKDARVTSTVTYHTTKFKTRNFNGIWMIVYTNPKAWGASKTVILPDGYTGNALDFYKYLQSYGALRDIIEAGSTELPVDIRDHIWSLKLKNQKISGATQYAMVEGVAYDDLELSNITSLLEGYL